MKSTRRLKRFHAVMTIAWAVAIPVTVFTPLKSSILWIGLMSAYALMVGHFSSWQSGRIETKADEEREAS